MFHLTRAANFQKILKNGLLANECRKSYNSGPGVYLYEDIQASKHIKEYIHKSTDGLFIIAQVKIPEPDKLFMDEDALGKFGSNKLFPQIENEFPEEVSVYFSSKLVETGDPQQAKILTVDAFRLRPDPAYKTAIAASRVLTARYDASIPAAAIVAIYGLDNHMDNYPVLYKDGIVNRKEVSDFKKYNQ